ncbi:MAG TPA: AprI/Inh family metalloprotease inhibitor, partial [Beijerinckiaceae bacterium]|nr:AprI/Inh family metalloprotease inhibitor [Beijerinckiaceae bacterium]
IRAGGKDTGCLLTLDDKARGPKGSFKAYLGPGCPDQGLVIFDPVGWRIEKGRLALIARAGHQTHLDQQSDGTWMKDPKEGAALALKKL